MKKNVRKWLTVLLAAVFLCSIVLMLLQLQNYEEAAESYDQAQQIAFGGEQTVSSTEPHEAGAAPARPSVGTEPEKSEEVAVPPMDEAARYLQHVDVFALRQVNQEVLGWIYIPDTVISYPLMQTTERDKYLQRAWDGTPNGSGSIFLEKANRRDFTDFNTIIYGHHITNGTMFQPLLNYKDAEFLRGHEYVYITTDDQIYRYRIFSAYEAPVESDAYRLYFADNSAKEQAVAYYLQGRTEPTVSADDRILTLSTCTGTGVYTTRWVVQAVLDAQWKK